MTTKEEKKRAKRERKSERRRSRVDWRDSFKAFVVTFAIFVATHPWKVCIISFLFNGLLGFGMLNLPASNLLNNDIEDLYVPKNNPTQQKADNLLKLFPDTSGTEFYAHQSVKQPLYGEVLLWRHDRGNILEGNITYDQITDVIEYVKNISTFTVNGGHARYPDVCALRGGECVVHGEEIVAQIKNNTRGEISMDDLYRKGGQFYEGSLTNLAQYEVENDTLTFARYLKLRFYLRHDSEEFLQDSKLWQDHFITYMKKFIRKQYPQSLHIVFRHAGSFYEELGNDTFMDIPYFSFVFTVFLTYLGILVSGGNIISKRVNIGRIGIIVTPVSVLGAWGLLMGCGLEFTNTVGCIPLFIQCHQIVNALITLSHLSDVNDVKDAHKRIAYAVKESALPITLTTIVHVTSFAVGISSNYYVVRLVCIYFVTTMVFNYFNHFVFFTAALALHEHRIDAELHFCCWNQLTPREELQEAGRHWCVICCCSGKRPETREDTESGMERASRTLMSRLILTAPSKFVITLGFIVYVGFSVWGLTMYDMDSVQVHEVLPKSYFSNWDRHWSASFENDSIVQFIAIHPHGFLNNKTIVSDFEKSIKAIDYLRPESFQSWYEVFEKSKYSNVSSEIDFVKSVKDKFLPKNPAFQYDVVFDKIRPRVIASRFYMRTRDVPSTKAMMLIKEDLHDLVEEINDYVENQHNDADEDDVYPFTWKVDDEKYFIVHSPDFRATDWYKLPLWEILKVCGVQFGLLYILMLVLDPSLHLAVQIPLTYFSIVAGMFGISHFLGIYLTPVPMISYITATCYSVEVIAHTFHAFMHADGTDRAARTNRVLSTTSQALFHTIFGQMLGVLVLSVVESYVFQTVFLIFTLITCICSLHAVTFLPTLLSLLGPGDDKLPQESIDSFSLQPVYTQHANGNTNGNANGNANGNTNGHFNAAFQHI